MVIETNLHGAVVTTHMMLSFGVILLLNGLVARVLSATWTVDPLVKKAWLPALPVAMVLTVLQTGLGAQVRERVDAVASSAADFHQREGWVDQIGAILSVHTTVAMLVVLVNLWLAFRLFNTGGKSKRVGMALVTVLVVQVMLSSSLVAFDLPIALQPLQLLGAAVLSSLQAFLLMMHTDNRSSLVPAQGLART